MGARYLVSPSIRKAPSAYAIALGLPLRMLIPPTRFSKSVACTWRYHGQNSDDASVTVARYGGIANPPCLNAPIKGTYTVRSILSVSCSNCYHPAILQH
ncbi:hypothetical protein OPQ81_011369 [Rhizoctonia solani]|nr:hypothetical protein OPQ81_011369 [Rhizoctonia solani]